MKARSMLTVQLLGMLLVSRICVAQGAYSVAEIGHLGGGSSSARGLNDAGQVVGVSTNAAGDSRPYLWQNGVMVDIGSPGFSDGVATDINNNGQICGSASNKNDPNGAAVFYSGGVMTVLPGLGGGASSALGLSDNGVIIGTSEKPSSGMKNVRWVNGAISELPLPFLADINDTGTVIGSAYWDVPVSSPPFVLRVLRATVVPLTGFSFQIGALDRERESWGRAINSSGVVAGESWIFNAYYPFIYRPSEGMTFLGGTSRSYVDVRDINDAEYVVCRWGSQGFICPPRGQLTRLTDLVPGGWTISDATRINNVGQILATGSYNGGPSIPVLLSPIRPVRLEATPSALHAGAPLTVSWDSTPVRKDWIGLYKVGASDEQLLWWAYTGDTPTGSRTIEAPAPAGQYEFRYFTDNSFTRVAISNPITTQIPAGYSLTVNPSVIAPGGMVNVRWTAPERDKIADWVGLFKVGTSNHEYLWWSFTDGTSSGEFSVPMPSEPGTYEFRYLYQSGFTTLARSQPVEVIESPSHTLSVTPTTAAPGGSVTVSWQAPSGSSSTDWIGLYREGESDNRSYLWPHWFYTGGAESGSRSVTMPNTPGRYVFRYLLNDGYSHKSESAVITVN